MLEERDSGSAPGTTELTVNLEQRIGRPSPTSPKKTTYPIAPYRAAPRPASRGCTGRYVRCVSACSGQGRDGAGVSLRPAHSELPGNPRSGPIDTPMAPNINKEDFTIANFQLQSDPVLHGDGCRMQALQFSFQGMKPQRRVVWIGF